MNFESHLEQTINQELEVIPNKSFVKPISYILDNISIDKSVPDTSTNSVSMEFYETLYEENPIMNFIIDVNFKVYSVNSYGANHLGFSKNELIGNDVISVFHEEDRKTVLKKLRECISSDNIGKLYEWQFRKITKNGDLMWVNEKVRSIKDKNNNILILIVCQDITNQKIIENDLNLYKQAFDNSNDLISFQDIDGTFTYANNKFCKKFDVTLENLKEFKLDNFLNNIDINKNDYNIASETLVHGYWVGEITHLDIHSNILTEEFNTFLITNRKDEVIGFGNVGRDITELKSNQNLLNETIKQKELLLKEVHHRVKNNLQSVISLISFEEQYVKDPYYLKIFNESKNRIHTISLLHDNLYHAADLSRVDFGLYINNLLQYLISTHKIRDKKINYKVNCENVFLGLDTAIPIGLIINELVTNSVKYAFPGEKEGTISIDLEFGKDIENMFSLCVSDNGIGLAKEFSLESSKTLGLQLVELFTKQLKATVEIKISTGTSFKIIFSNIKYKKRI